MKQKQKPKKQAFVNINFHNFKCSFTAFFIFSHSPLFLFFFLFLVHFSLQFLTEYFLKTSSFDIAKRKRGYVSTEARNLWKAESPGGHPAAKQKHKKAG